MILIINNQIAEKHHVRTVQSWPNAVLAQGRIPAEAICGHKIRKNNKHWDKSEDVWYPNHPHLVRHALSPSDLPRVRRLEVTPTGEPEEGVTSKAPPSVQPAAKAKISKAPPGFATDSTSPEPTQPKRPVPGSNVSYPENQENLAVKTAPASLIM